MKFLKLDRKNFDLFGDMDPFAMLKEDFPAGRFAMGFFGTHKGYDYPVGLVICTETADSLVIEWMMVYAQGRGHGVGSYMLSELVQLAERFAKPKLQAIFPESPAREILCQGEEIYFKLHGFLLKEEYEGIYLRTLPEEYYEVAKGKSSRYPYELDYMLRDIDTVSETVQESFDASEYECFSLEALGKAKLISKIPEDQLSDIESLADLGIQDMVQVINESFTSAPKGIVLANQDDFDISTTELSVSCVIRHKDKTEALLYVTAGDDDTLVVRKFMVSGNMNRSNIAYMLKYAYMKMSEKYDASCRLYINNSSDNAKMFTELIRGKK